jgi:hypothetical protein
VLPAVATNPSNGLPAGASNPDAGNANGLPVAAVPTTGAKGGSQSTASPNIATATPAGPAAPGAQAAQGVPTPTTCAPQAGWVVYTIMPGDSLWSLADRTNSSVEAIKFGNCKQDDLLVAYDTIHLPRRPSAPVVVVPPPTSKPVVVGPTSAVETPVPPQPTVDPCASIFDCPASILPTLSLPEGGPDHDKFVPCADGKTGPRIDSPKIKDKYPISVGIAEFFFACGFNENAKLSAWVTRDLYAQDLDVVGLGAIPAEFVSEVTPANQKLAGWYPTCDLIADEPYVVNPTTMYTIHFSDGTSNAEAIVQLKKVSYATIMVKPKFLWQGQDFDIYYCGYGDFAKQLVQIKLYKSTGNQDLNGWVYDHLNSWNVLIGQGGWAVQRQTVALGTQASRYFLVDSPEETDGEVYFWVLPQP